MTVRDMCIKAKEVNIKYFYVLIDGDYGVMGAASIENFNRLINSSISLEKVKKFKVYKLQALDGGYRECIDIFI